MAASVGKKKWALTCRRISLFTGKLLLAAGVLYWLISDNRLDFSALASRPNVSNTGILLGIGVLCTLVSLPARISHEALGV